ncbi:SRPBCC family protein [Flavobacterium sp.]|uniref:SRPBCC family protein n=1 Tax=Flavobacterium sp. TaxID=239 RepID=UPI0039E6A1D5
MQNQPLLLERLAQAPIEKVWRALTEIQQLKQWFFPMMEHFEPQPGFETAFDVHHNGHVYPHLIKVVEADAPQNLAYTWRYGGYPGNSIVRFELEALGNQTQITLTHAVTESFFAEQYPDFSENNFKLGWTHFIEALQQFAAR